jgi:hypothetical protein
MQQSGRTGDHMPKSSSKHPQEKDFLKRRSLDDGIKLADAAHVATWRLYCEALNLWRACKGRQCRRHRRCLGEPAGCLMRGLPGVSQAQRLDAAMSVVGGGPRCIAPATHLEWLVRREPLPKLTSWRGLASAEASRGQSR